METKNITFPSKKYLVWRKEIEIKNIMDQTMWRNAYKSVHEYIHQHKLKITGPGVCLYFRWDDPKGKGEIGIGNPIDDSANTESSLVGDLAFVSVPEPRAIMATVHGTYDNSPPTILN